MGITRRKKIARRKKSLVKKHIPVVREKKEEARWVCLSVAERYKRSNEFKNAISAIKAIIGKDCIHLIVIGTKLDENHYLNVMDGYVFIKCRSINTYVQELEQSKFISSILYSYENICFIDESEIRLMIHDYRMKHKDLKKDVEICYGDMVEIKSGRYASLIGVVSDKIKDRYLVCFNFNFGMQKEKVLYENMTIKGNIFDRIKCPA